MTNYLILMIFLLSTLWSTAHPWKPKHFIIIDTDASVDDFYTLNTLLSDPEVRVLAIIISSGATPAQVGYQKVKCLLADKHHEGILVGINEQKVLLQPDKTAMAFSWSNSNYPNFVEQSVQQVLERIAKHNHEPLTFINLAGLQTLNLFLNANPESKKQIKEILWNIEEPINKAFNYRLAPNAYQELTEKALSIKTQNTLRELFSDQELFLGHQQAFNTFPLDSSHYISEIALHAKSTQEKYGVTEWGACVITNELHRHVGIYAIIGVKMGIRALEYFGAGVDEMRITSYAGTFPPISCINDGIQASTGATLGHGLIKIAQTNTPEPKMVFEYLGQELCITLKPDYKKQVQRDLQQLAAVHGINNDIYWELVRKIALNCWFNWDRDEIFELNCESNP